MPLLRCDALAPLNVPHSRFSPRNLNACALSPAVPLLKQDPRTDGAITTRTGTNRRSRFEVHFLGRNFARASKLQRHPMKSIRAGIPTSSDDRL